MLPVFVLLYLNKKRSECISLVSYNGQIEFPHSPDEEIILKKEDVGNKKTADTGWGPDVRDAKNFNAYQSSSTHPPPLNFTLSRWPNQEKQTQAKTFNRMYFMKPVTCTT